MSTTGDHEDPFRPPGEDERRDPRQEPRDEQAWGWGSPSQPAQPSWDDDRAAGGPSGWSTGGPDQQAYGSPAVRPDGTGARPEQGGWTPDAPDHPEATKAMVLGLVALVGGFFCLLPLLVAPYAMVVGRRTVKEIDAGHGRQGGRGQAQAGFVMGLIGTVLIGLGVVAIVLVVIFFASLLAI